MNAIMGEEKYKHLVEKYVVCFQIILGIILLSFVTLGIYKPEGMEGMLESVLNFWVMISAVIFWGFFLSLPMVFVINKKAGFKGLISWIVVMLVIFLWPMLSSQEIKDAKQRNESVMLDNEDNASLFQETKKVQKIDISRQLL